MIVSMHGCVGISTKGSRGTIGRTRSVRLFQRWISPITEQAAGSARVRVIGWSGRDAVQPLQQAARARLLGRVRIAGNDALEHGDRAPVAGFA